jgi:hypothetical protein
MMGLEPAKVHRPEAPAGRRAPPLLEARSYNAQSMFWGVRNRFRALGICVLALSIPALAAPVGRSWAAQVTDAAGRPVAQAVVGLHASAHTYTATTGPDGKFALEDIASDSYALSVTAGGRNWKASERLLVTSDQPLPLSLELGLSGQISAVSAAAQQNLGASGAPASPSSGGQHLSSEEVSSLPLNARDFSKLLLLAAGTMTDTNGAANFTQQFAVNGQRGVTTVFATDGFDTTDPEMGGATFSNFNVDAIQEVQSNSGVLSADLGHGAAGFTNLVTKSGVDQIHGSFFAFVRNAAFDARNYFDPLPAVSGRRIPPFARNEFGLTNGGPVVLPGVYDGRKRTFYFFEYQGFRQVLGTTQVLPVPSVAERQGMDTATYPGDTLTIPVSPLVVPVLEGYPLPNEPDGAFGDRTYAASSKVVTNSDQFSIRVDHRLSSRASLITRFSLDDTTGPLTNPDQTALNPTFGIQFYDHQRNTGVHYTRQITPHFTSDTSIGYIRSTPFFPTTNRTQPGITFADGIYQPYFQPAGSIFGAYGNLYQLKQDLGWIRGRHAFKWGIELRVNRDATIFGTNPNGLYEFGGGVAYSPVNIVSASGMHNIAVGDPLPDSLTSLLTATPYSFNITVPASITPIGNKFDEAGVRREAYNFYFADVWKANQRLSLNYGLRYEVNSRIHEATKRTSDPVFLGPKGQNVPYGDTAATEELVINPQPPYAQDWYGWGPRAGLDYSLTRQTVFHLGGAITTLLPNLWQDNFLTAAMPYVFSPSIYAQPQQPIAFQDAFVPLTLPTAYNLQGQPVFADGRSQDVPPNTGFDFLRFQKDLDALLPGNVQLLNVPGMARNFGNGYIASWTAGVEHSFGDFKLNAAYVATAGIHLARVYNSNGYGGACHGFAPFTQFDSPCHATGGFGPETIMTSGSHSTYHGLQTGLTKNSAKYGLGLAASYTYSKALDDTSSVLGGLLGASGTILQASPQNPWDPSAEKGPSTFDVTHVFAASLIQLLPFERLGFLRPVSRTLTKGWQFLNITSLTTGSPFTVFSGVQQTGAGFGGGDRPDLVSLPHFSTSRPVRDDYFGMGANNPSFFNIPINLPGGSGPNAGRFGTLGRDTFRGPGYHDYDFALIKDTPFGHRGNGELGTLEFRAEFFDLFNLVNFGLPSNIVTGSGFGIISKTAGTSRQIQFSLKVIY